MRRGGNFQCNVALVGASTLKGKEVKSLLQERGFPIGKLVLLDEPEVQGQLTDFDEEPVFLRPVEADSFANMTFAIFASSPSFTTEHWPAADRSGCEIVDLSYGLEDHPRARLRAPLVESLWEEPEESPTPRAAADRLSVAAHPAAMAIAGVLGQLSRHFAVERCVVTAFEPVSERGKAGLDELHRQTVSLLAFQEIPRQVYDSQVAFNLLSAYGGQCRSSLREVQQRIVHHTQGLLRGRSVPPALRLLQVPTFYSHAFCCFVELAKPVAPEEMEEALNHPPFHVNRDREDQPTAVSVAGSSEILLGVVERDAACQAGYWVWGAMDNVRLAALNAVAIAEEILYSGVRQEH